MTEINLRTYIQEVDDLIEEGQHIPIDDLDHTVSVYRTEHFGEPEHRRIQEEISEIEVRGTTDGDPVDYVLRSRQVCP